MRIRITKAPQRDKTVYVAVRAGEAAGFAAIRYDLRHLLRGAGIVLSALAVIRRLFRVR